MTRKELAAVLIEKAGFEAGKIAEIVDQVFEIMKEALEKREKIKIPGFGVFNVRGKKARLGRNPVAHQIMFTRGAGCYSEWFERKGL